jgi:hypothetical protein
MSDFLQGWKQFLNENKQLDEIKEEELSDIDDVLHNLDPTDLSFNNMFGDKMRLVIPLKEKEPLKDLTEFLEENGYEPDYTAGLATYYAITLPGKEGERPTTMMMNRIQKQGFIDKEGEVYKRERDTDETYESRKKMIRKKQVKIGKLLQKGARLWDKTRDSQKEYKESQNVSWSLNRTAPGEPEAFAAKQKVTADYEQLNKAEGALQDSFSDFQDQPYSSVRNPFKKLLKKWEKRGKANYSMIMSRHPIDVMRMSDFDAIESCHSPPSRSGGDGGSYYKCAVAEAHGHGIVSYVVKNDDLNELEAEGSYQEKIDAYQENEEELFWDAERSEGEITPISRLRLRKFTHPRLEITLAVPSQKIYGPQTGGSFESITDWAKEEQADIIQKIEDSKNSDDPKKNAFDEHGDAIDLSKWEMHGGSYVDYDEDASKMFFNFLGYKTTGRPSFDSTTEDNLQLQGGTEAVQREVDEMVENYNNRHSSTNVHRASVEDDGGGEYYIDIAADCIIKIDEGDLKYSAFQEKTRTAIESIADELINGYGWAWLDDRVDYTVRNGQVVMEIPVDISDINPREEDYASDTDNLSEILAALSFKDSGGSQIEEMVLNILRRRGVAKSKNPLYNLVAAWRDESWYEWNFDFDDEHMPSQATVDVSVEVNFNDLIKKIPITFDHQPDKSSEVYIMFAGDPLALAARRDDGEGNFVDFEVRSPEFEHERMDGFKNLDDVKAYAQWAFGTKILRPDGTLRGAGSMATTHSYNVAVRQLIREAIGEEEEEFTYPNSTTYAGKPDFEDDFKMTFEMDLNEDHPEAQIENALKIATDVDDKDQLREIFRTAFAKVAKIPDETETLKEVREYFNKFDFF